VIQRTALTLVLLIAIALGTASCTGVEPTAKRSVVADAKALPIDRGLFADQLLVYAFHGFSAAEIARVRTGVTGAVTPVVVAQVAVASGMRGYPIVPVETMASPPSAYAAAVGRPALEAAFSSGAVLSQTESRLRRLGTGGVLRLADGRRVTVSAVVDDHVLGGNEMMLPARLMPPARSAATYLLVADEGDAAGVAQRVRRLFPARKVRTRTKTANGFFSADDTVLTQAQIKNRFGEFALRRTADGSGFVPDPQWTQKWLAENQHVPQLGDVTCNREVLRALVAAMREVTARGLDATVHTADFQLQGGCWNPSVVPLSGGSVSRHAWGIAVDINVDANDLGARPRQDPRLLEIMRRHGFAWGGEWLRPDGMHFEWVGASAQPAG
jgi:hypothetical protein